MRPVEIVDYDPAWPALFAAERGRLLALLDGLVDDVHHIGSTAVQGLAAKPKIDMDAVLRANGLLPEAIERVRSGGAYDYHGDPYGDGRWTFTRGRSSGTRLYLCGPDNEAHAKRLLFCNWLRTHPNDAAAYAALKRKLAVAAKDDFAFYTKGKSDFVAGILRRAAAHHDSQAPAMAVAGKLR
jgi:GrpB-like predicted nucleotidyltransferase (UPF0157 family)